MKWTRFVVAAMGLVGIGAQAMAQELVVVESDRLVIIDLGSGSGSPVIDVPVRASLQDVDGNWWMVIQKEGGDQLAWLPADLDGSKLKIVVDSVSSTAGEFRISLTPKGSWNLTIYSFAERLENSAQCGSWTDTFLCTEQMGWGNPEVEDIHVSPERLAELQISAPGSSPAADTTTAPPAHRSAPIPEGLRSLECACWGEAGDCGRTHQLGAWELVMVDIECGDLAHFSCVLYDRGTGLYASPLLRDLAKGPVWKSGSEWTEAPEFDASCGPLWMDPTGGFLSDGDQTWCSLGPEAPGCHTTEGRFLGSRGGLWKKIGL